MIATARLTDTIAAEKRPVVGTPIIKPQTILRHDQTPHTFELCIGPPAVFIRIASAFCEIIKSKLAHKRIRYQRLAALGELESVAGQKRFPVRDAAKLIKQINDRQFSFLRDRANGVGVLRQLPVPSGQVWQRGGTGIFKWSRNNQREAHIEGRQIVKQLFVSVIKHARGTPSTQNLSATELQDHDRRFCALQVLFQRRKAHHARPFEDGVAFPSEISKAHSRELNCQQRLEVSGVLRSRHIRPAHERHGVATF